MITASKFGPKIRPLHFLLFFILALGTFARFKLIGRGHNYDFESYRIVVEANQLGVTAWQTNRYNYGPVWWYLLRLADWMHTYTGIGFRHQIVGILTAADLFIAYFIYRFKGLFLGVLFFLNPISIIISGYHNQFDNLAIAIACYAIIKLDNVQKKHLKSSDVSIVLLLAASLAIKHVFLFFIVWLAMRQKTILLKCAYLLGPLILLALSFGPYLTTSWHSIKLNVIDYRSYDNAPFWKVVGLFDGEKNQTINALFVILILAIGFVLRKIKLSDSILIYCIVIVAFSPGITNQYLAIAAIGAIGLMNVGFVTYILYGAFWLIVSPDGLHFVQNSRFINVLLFNGSSTHGLTEFGYEPFPILLVFGLLAFFINQKRLNA